MKENENVKKSSKKWIIAVAIIAIIVIAATFYLGVFSIPTGLATTQTNTPKNTEKPSAPQITITGTEILNKEFKQNLPYYEAVDLESGRYILQIKTSKPVMIMVYDESHFKQWQEGRMPNFNAGTGYGVEFNTDDFMQKFDVSINAKGKYYIAIIETGEVSISLKLIQEMK